MTRKRSRKEKVKEAAEEENGVDSQQDVETDNESSKSEPESKKKKSEKRKTSSSKKNKKQEVEEQEKTDESEDDVQYEVEEVIDEKMVKGVRHYLIRWKGYDHDGDTWEPEDTLDCPDLVKKFKEQKSNDENESPKKGRKGKTAQDDADADSSKKGKKENRSAKKGKDSKKDEKQSKKRTSKNLPEPEIDWESDDEFQVERILDVYFKKNGQREFLVSWKGYPNSQDSWEPEENLDCTDLIQKFMNKVQQAKLVEQKELRLNRTRTERFTLNMYAGAGDGSRRLSRRLGKKQRVQYHDAE